MKLFFVFVFLSFFCCTTKVVAQFTKVSKEEIEKMKAEGINVIDSAGKIYIKPNPNYIPPKKPKPQKITDTKDDNKKQKEACECLKLIYTVSANGYFLGCF